MNKINQKINIVFKLKTGKQNQVFGSISTKQISEELSKHGLKIDKKKIKLSSPITSLGFHIINIELRKDVVAQIKVQVIKEN